MKKYYNITLQLDQKILAHVIMSEYLNDGCFLSCLVVYVCYFCDF